MEDMLCRGLIIGVYSQRSTLIIVEKNTASGGQARPTTAKAVDGVCRPVVPAGPAESQEALKMITVHPGGQK